MTTQEKVDEKDRRGLDSVRIRYVTLSLLIIAGHAGGFQFSDEIQFFGLKLAQATRPQLLYAMAWASLLWLSFVYWQHFRQSPDYLHQKPYLLEQVRNRIIQYLYADKSSDEKEKIREVTVAPDFASAHYRLHSSDKSTSPYKEHVIETEVLLKFRKRAYLQLLIYKPETIGLLLPFVLAASALVVAIIDWKARH